MLYEVITADDCNCLGHHSYRTQQQQPHWKADQPEVYAFQCVAKSPYSCSLVLYLLLHHGLSFLGCNGVVVITTAAALLGIILQENGAYLV